MHAIRTWKDQLESIHKRTGLYWASPELPFTSLQAFLVGYQCGYGVAKQGYDILPEQLVPQDFHRFVAEHLGEAYPTSKGWQGLIREHTSSEREAFDLFFQLRDEYERQDTKVG
jgi:hypothetical protein